MTALDLLIASLAAWRVAHIALRENGPWSIFARIRGKLGVVTYPDGSGRVARFRWEITVCMWCLSVWGGIIAAAGLYFAATVTLWLLLPFAISAVCVILDGPFGVKK